MTQETIEVDLAGPVPKVGPEHIPTAVIDELRTAYRIAADYSGAFNDVASALAEKYKTAPGALKRYIRALEGDDYCSKVGCARDGAPPKCEHRYCRGEGDTTNGITREWCQTCGAELPVQHFVGGRGGA